MMNDQAMGRLGLEAATAFNAANYLDRFLSINCHLVGKSIDQIGVLS